MAHRLLIINIHPPAFVQPVLHRFAPSLVESGFEGFSMVFDWSE